MYRNIFTNIKIIVDLCGSFSATYKTLQTESCSVCRCLEKLLPLLGQAGCGPTFKYLFYDWGWPLYPHFKDTE